MKSLFVVRFLLVALAAVVVAALPTRASDYSAPFAFSTVAGDSSIGSNDGPGSVARFYTPRGIALDRHGNLYVADAVNDTVRKITPDGLVSTLAGTAGIFGAGMLWNGPLTIDGTGPQAIFSNPEGITVDDSGNVFVTDKMAFCVRRITPDGTVTTFAGKAFSPGEIDGPAATARFDVASAAVADANGNIYLSEWMTCLIRKITPSGDVTTLAGKSFTYGSTDGPGDQARFAQPNGLAIDKEGSLYVADTVNCTIRKITAAGIVSTVAGKAGEKGSADGAAADARFYRPTGVAVDAAGNVYVADTYNSTIRKIDSSGNVTTLAGLAGRAGSADGTGSAARFRTPVSLVVDAKGVLFIADQDDNTIRKVTPDGVVTTVAGLGIDSSFGSADGVNGRFNPLGNTAVGPDGTVYVADPLNATIRRVATNGTVTTLAGKAGVTGFADGNGSDARFQEPYGIAVDSNGTVYVADPGNDTIRKITPQGAVTTIAGDATAGPGFADGNGSRARFSSPSGIALNRAGILYVADSGNSMIRQIWPGGDVTTLAGKAGATGSADGNGTDARFQSPSGVAVDSFGNILVADTGNQTIRRVTPTGDVTTLAGHAGQAGNTDGDVKDAKFAAPSGVAADATGAIYVADSANHLIRRISAEGKVTTLGGLAGSSGYANGIGKISRFSSPSGVALGAAGQLFLTSGATLRVGQIPGPVTITTQPQGAARKVGESMRFIVVADGVPAPTYQWYVGNIAIPGATSASLTLSNLGTNDAGDYSVVITNALGSVTSAKATLTVEAPAPPAPATGETGAGSSTSSAASTSTAGGGGSISAGFALGLLVLFVARRSAVRYSASFEPEKLPGAPANSR